MDVPTEIIYEIAYYLDVYAIASLSCTCKSYNVFYDEHLWQKKCHGNKQNYALYIDAYVGVKIPLMQHGDCVKYIRYNDKQIYPSTKNYIIALISDRGEPMYYVPPYKNIILLTPGYSFVFKHDVVSAMIVDASFLSGINYNTLWAHVDKESYSSKSKIPIYGYTVEYMSFKHKDKQFNILENVSVVPKVVPLKDIPRENKFMKILDSVRLTKIHSLESILRHFITEDEINKMNDEQMREKIKVELQLIHHILPNRISFK